MEVDKVNQNDQQAAGHSRARVNGDQAAANKDGPVTMNGAQDQPTSGKPDWTQLYRMKSHPLAVAFPLMHVAQLQELADDIKAHGLREPIISLDGMILDGQNRMRACELSEVFPRIVAFGNIKGNNASPVEYVLGQNLRRRHMNDSERAMAAARISLYQEKHPTTPANPRANLHGGVRIQTRKNAAKMLDVSERSVASARKIIEKGIPKLAEAVNAGGVAVSTAAEVATLTPAQQEEVVSGGRDAIGKAAKQVREARTSRSQHAPHEKTSKTKPSTIDLSNGIIDKPDGNLEHVLRQGWLAVSNGSVPMAGSHAILLTFAKALPPGGELKAFLESAVKLGGGVYVTPHLNHLVGDSPTPKHPPPEDAVGETDTDAVKATRRTTKQHNWRPTQAEIDAIEI